MKTFLTTEDSPIFSKLHDLSRAVGPRFDLFENLYNLYFNITFTPVPIPHDIAKTIHYNTNIISLSFDQDTYSQDKPLSRSYSYLSTDIDTKVLAQQELIENIQNLNPNLSIIIKTPLLDEISVYNLSYLGVDSFYIYAHELDVSLIQYYIEIGREFKTEPIVLVSCKNDFDKVVDLDIKMLGITNKDSSNNNLNYKVDKIDLFNYILDHRPKLVLVYDSSKL